MVVIWYTLRICCYTDMNELNDELIAELGARFQINDDYFLGKALAFLEQFQSGSVFKGRKRVKASEVKGISPEDRAFIILSLNDAFGRSVIQRVDTYETYYIDQQNQNEVSEKVGVDFVYENTEYLETAISILKFIKSEQSNRLSYEKGKFQYRGKPFKTKKGSNLRNLLDAVFSITAGHSRDLITYQDLFVELQKLKKYANKSPKQLKQLVHKHLTTKGYGLVEKIGTDYIDSIPLFETVDGVGIKFLNKS